MNEALVHLNNELYFYMFKAYEKVNCIRAFGSWPLAKLSAKRKKAIIEGPICQSSQVVGWHINNLNMEAEGLGIHISSIGFNSSILWDPRRWGRLPAEEATNQVRPFLLKTLIIWGRVKQASKMNKNQIRL